MTLSLSLINTGAGAPQTPPGEHTALLQTSSCSLLVTVTLHFCIPLGQSDNNRA